MSASVTYFLVVGALLILVGAIALPVWIVRTLLRIVALRAAVVLLQADGTSGSATAIAAEMFSFLVGRRTRAVKR